MPPALMRWAETIDDDAVRERATASAELLRPLLAPLAASGMSLRAMALAAVGSVTRDGTPLAAVQVARLLDRLELRAA